MVQTILLLGNNSYLFLTGQSSNIMRKGPAYLSYGNGQNLKNCPSNCSKLLLFNFNIYFHLFICVNINQAPVEYEILCATVVEKKVFDSFFRKL